MVSFVFMHCVIEELINFKVDSDGGGNWFEEQGQTAEEEQQIQHLQQQLHQLHQQQLQLQQHPLQHNYHIQDANPGQQRTFRHPNHHQQTPGSSSQQHRCTQCNQQPQRFQPLKRWRLKRQRQQHLQQRQRQQQPQQQCQQCQQQPQQQRQQQQQPQQHRQQRQRQQQPQQQCQRQQQPQCQKCPQHQQPYQQQLQPQQPQPPHLLLTALNELSKKGIPSNYSQIKVACKQSCCTDPLSANSSVKPATIPVANFSVQKLINCGKLSPAADQLESSSPAPQISECILLKQTNEGLFEQVSLPRHFVSSPRYSYKTQQQDFPNYTSTKEQQHYLELQSNPCPCHQGQHFIQGIQPHQYYTSNPNASSQLFSLPSSLRCPVHGFKRHKNNNNNNDDDTNNDGDSVDSDIFVDETSETVVTSALSFAAHEIVPSCSLTPTDIVSTVSLPATAQTTTPSTRYEYTSTTYATTTTHTSTTYATTTTTIETSETFKFSKVSFKPAVYFQVSFDNNLDDMNGHYYQDKLDQNDNAGDEIISSSLTSFEGGESSSFSNKEDGELKDGDLIKTFSIQLSSQTSPERDLQVKTDQHPSMQQQQQQQQPQNLQRQSRESQNDSMNFHKDSNLENKESASQLKTSNAIVTTTKMTPEQKAGMTFTIDFGSGGADRPEITDSWKKLVPYKVHQGS
ncbi:hypothetical protein HELRODRAFT_170932 [Helobdella robusta]|uniref:Uncharacterized protein n=1 Tax=Helobdella robusta TaxID=6412 RepID=T1F3M0_HELRO|nr:hypothetical protein HELRODRAFT_170932 [Helobdella robusta]ESO06897.1 hypothetical protein HELRODRAFT_170932 [Helobdella robusta]